MRFLRVISLVLLFAGVPALTPAQPRPSADEFEPMTEVPPEEQIPAINLVAAAYGFVWIVVVGYVWTLGRRLQKAEDEIAALERRGR